MSIKMQIKNQFLTTVIYLLLFLLLAVVVFSPIDVDRDTCQVVSGVDCSFGDKGVISLDFFSPGLDSHATNFTPNAASSGFNNHLCCDYNGTDTYITTDFCPHQPLFAMWDISSAHIAQNRSDGAPWNVCAVSYDGFTHCSYNPGNGACDSTQTLVGSFDSASPWNSHYGEGSYLTTNICCTFNTSIILQGVNIAQFEYWCGVEDNVCPEDYYNSTGGHPVCYPREDPDC